MQKLNEGQTVDVNSASEPLLRKVPWVGAKVAADLVAFRPFDDWSDLLRKVGGLGKGYREAMEPFITFGPDDSNVQVEAVAPAAPEQQGESVDGYDELNEVEEPQPPKPRRLSARRSRDDADFDAVQARPSGKRPGLAEEPRRRFTTPDELTAKALGRLGVSGQLCK